ncbi:MAG: hypothetical protein A3A28_02010 [Candidatus Sungbacteria bacterium RIFCSPLOWO2_01_FULL_47_32]|uniref:Uncharacterized protein n=1 Tax=Candidatus Sungbacteria bacterium RIFCSPHIGHO2_01_FULL_47_32 TaxID=1802264 RepID=A0A1G2K8A0_9BACT|nr:MAG: hypothetical protein A2633_05800 [Candidatus Sungbacteria bacterium RIFCSPHIGHO2_01_FULL_47_32]OHA04460.1 MAG: hypothetical protein A3A28_02010 [Candidatus Sungbacteria bacterium RIFCSPLOWO2_01_FULL_47_32]
MALGESPVKQALRWIIEELQSNPSASMVKLIDLAGQKFNLSPLDSDFLSRHFAETRAKNQKK